MLDITVTAASYGDGSRSKQSVYWGHKHTRTPSGAHRNKGYDQMTARTVGCFIRNCSFFCNIVDHMGPPLPMKHKATVAPSHSMTGKLLAQALLLCKLEAIGLHP
jgi:hypothetical protein